MAGKKKKEKQSKLKAQEPEVLPSQATPEVTEEEPFSPDELDERESALPIEDDEDDVIEVEKTGDIHLPAKDSSQVVSYDPLEAYLREIRAYPPLSREEEKELALKYYHDKDLEAAYRLVTSNLWLVVKIARDYEKAARGLLDLVQEGNIGLMEAVKNFDPFRGVRFPSYAVWWIKAYIVRYLIANWRLVKIGTTQAQRKLFFNLKKEKDKLEREGFFPAPKLLAEKLQVRESDIIEMEQRLGSSDMSVDAPLPGSTESNLLSVLPAKDETQEDLLAKKTLQRLLNQGLEEFAATLKPNELLIYNERMLGEEKATLQDISEKLDISRERVRQIENRLRERLKEFLEKRLGVEVTDQLKAY